MGDIEERRVIRYTEDKNTMPKLTDWALKYVIGDMPEKPTRLEITSEVSFIDPNSISRPLTWLEMPEVPGLETDNSHTYFRLSNCHRLIIKGVDNWEGKCCFYLRDDKMDYFVKNGKVSESYPRIQELSIAELEELERKEQRETFLTALKNDKELRLQLARELNMSPETLSGEGRARDARAIDPAGGIDKTDIIIEKLDKILQYQELMFNPGIRTPAGTPKILYDKKLLLKQQSEKAFDHWAVEEGEEIEDVEETVNDSPGGTKKRFLISIDGKAPISIKEAAELLEIDRSQLSKWVRKGRTLIKGHQLTRIEED